MALYTPFFQRAAQTVAQGYGQKRIGTLTQSAYMGDQRAMQELAQIDPNAANQIRQQKTQEEQVKLSQAAQAQQMQANQQQIERGNQQWALQNRELIQGVMEKAARMPDFQSAQQYIDSEIQGLQQSGVQVPQAFSAQTFTPETFEQIKKAFPPLAKEGFTLGPQETRFDASGNVLAQNSAPRDGAANQRDDKIAGLTQRLASFVPNPAATAADIVDGNIEVEVLEDGSVRLVDKIKAASGRGSEAVIELPVGSLMSGDGRASPEAGQSLYRLADEAGGVGGAARQVGALLAGQFGTEAYPETVEAYQTIDTAVSDMIRGMAVNDRFPVGEMERLRDEIKITPSIMNPGPVAKARMRSVDRSLKTRLSQFERDAIDTTLSADVRNQQRTNAANIRNFLDILGVPEKMPISELSVPAIGEMNRSDARDAIRQITEEEFNQLPTEVVNALMRKAGG